ncbi:MAG: virulence factor TspB C-terminal domain-related protein [Candidatus Bathyarchaeia archaeon]
MGLPRILGLCVALLPFSALASDPPVPRGNVSTTLNPITSYYQVNSSTLNTPQGVSVSPIRDITPHVSRYSGGMQQTLPTGITINAINKGAPLPVVARATTNSLKTAATRCLTGFKCNLAMQLGALGIQELLNGVGWLMEEGGSVSKVSPPLPDPLTPSCPPGYQCATNIYSSGGCTPEYPNRPFCDNGIQMSKDCTATSAGPCYFYQNNGIFSVVPSYSYVNQSFSPLAATFVNSEGYTIGFYTNQIQSPITGPKVPVDDAEISDAVNSRYNPDPSDWLFLSPQLTLDDLEITSSPTLQGEPKTTTEFDANGNPFRVRETNIWFDFDVKDNPSPKPSLDLKQRQEEKTYEDGQLTGSTETTTTIPAPTYAGGGGSQQPPIELEIPTDCDFMPTVCAFLDWFKEPNPELDQEQDLAQLINDEDFERNYSINFGVNVCPAPIEINVIFLNKTVQLSYEPACELASYAKPFVLISAYIFAIMITLGVVRNG